MFSTSLVILYIHFLSIKFMRFLFRTVGVVLSLDRPTSGIRHLSAIYFLAIYENDDSTTESMSVTSTN
jgi:hypothetical protein